MSRVKPNSICFFCEYGLTPRRNPPTQRRTQQARHASSASPNPPVTRKEGDTAKGKAVKDVALSPEQLRNQLFLKSTSDVWRRSLFGVQAVMRGRGINHRLMAYQDRLQADEMKDYEKRRSKRKLHREQEEKRLGLPLPQTSRARETEEDDPQTGKIAKTNASEVEGEGIPDFIRLYDPNASLESASVTVQLLRYQFRSCTSPEDFTRVISVLLDTRPGMPNADGRGARILANQNVQRIIAHSLKRYDATRALCSLSLLIRRLETHKERADISIIQLALACALRCHNMVAARKYLQLFSEAQPSQPQTDAVATILPQLLSALKAGLLNHPPRSRNAPAVLEILYSQPSSSPESGSTQPHLRPSLRSYLRPYTDWIDILAFCSATDRLRSEWTHLQSRLADSTSSWADKGGKAVFDAAAARIFMHAFFTAGAPADAWAIFEKHGDKIAMSDEVIWEYLLDNAEEKPELPEDLQKTVENKFTARLEKMLHEIEGKMGIKWVAGADGEEGHHDVSAAGVEEAVREEDGEETPVDVAEEVKEVTRFAIEREEEIMAQKDDILAGRDPRPYKAPFS